MISPAVSRPARERIRPCRTSQQGPENSSSSLVNKTGTSFLRVTTGKSVVQPGNKRFRESMLHYLKETSQTSKKL